MLKPAFSTIACPEWTLERVASSARQYGFEAVELRTFGPDSRELACDPALTDEGKVRDMFLRRGVEVLSLGTSIRFDEPIKPPVLGLVISDTEKSVREAIRAIDHAIALGCPLVRVFGFEFPAREKRASAIARIAKRLTMALDHARNTGVRLALENGGSFATAAEVAEVIAAVGNPLLGAAYSLAAAHAAGDDFAKGIATLGDRLWMARLSDAKGGVPCPLGQGDLPCREFTQALCHAGVDGPLVYDWPALWIDGLDPAENVLPHAATAMFKWIADARAGSRASAPVAASA